MKARKPRSFTLSALTVAILAALAAPAVAADTFWIGTDGDWHDAANWDNGVPGFGDNAILNKIKPGPPLPGNGYIATYINPGSTSPSLNLVLVEGGMTVEHPAPAMFDGSNLLTTDNMGLGLSTGQMGTYKLSGKLEVNTITVVGGEGIGQFQNNSGTHNTGPLTLGVVAGSKGVYTLTDISGGFLGATLAVDGDTVVGDQGNGSFMQTFGSHSVSGDLKVAVGAGSISNYQLFGLGLPLPGVGSLDVANSTVVGDEGRGTFTNFGGTHDTADLIVGRAGVGEYTQEGGLTTVTSRFVVAEQDGSTGTYNLHGGVLEDPVVLVGATVGDAGVGTFDNMGGTHNVHGDLVVGNQGTGYGYYFLQDDSVNTLEGKLNVDGSTILGNEGSGSFEQYSGTHTIQGNLIMANASGSYGNYVMEDGSLTVHGSEIVGKASNGSFAQYDGMHTVSGDLIVAQAGNAEFSQYGGDISVSGHYVAGEQFGSHAGVSLHNGLLENQMGAIVGDAGYSTFYNGGEHQVTGDLILGNQATGIGNYEMGELGDLFVSGDTIVGRAGIGDFSHAVGGGSYHETGSLYLGGDPGGNLESGSSGTYTMSGGGQLLVHNWTVVGQDGVGVFNNDGGQHEGNFLLLGNSGSSFANSSGTYNLSGNGTVYMHDTTVGGFGYGEFNQSGGVHDVTANLVVGDGPAIGGTPARQGVYNLYGDGELYVGGDSIIGRGNDVFALEPGGKGSFTQVGGLHDVGGNLILGQTGSIRSGDGSYVLAGTGELYVTGSSIVGQGGTGIFDQYGGTHVTGTLIVGAAGGGQGTYNLHGGALYDGAIVGDAGTGVFNNTGSTQSSSHYVTGDLILGNQATGHGTYNLSGNTSGPNAAILDVSGNTVVGGAGTGVFNQSGGKHSADEVQIGATGTYNLSGGSLTAYAMSVAPGGKLNYSGGSLATIDSLVNDGQVNLSGAGTRTVAGDVTNNLNLNVTDTSAQFDHDVTNNGTFKVTGSDVHFLGTFTNYGIYNSDPSDSYFVDLIVGDLGYLIGGDGDNFHVGGDFFNHSTQNTDWDTDFASLFIDGVVTHEMYLAGLDLGAGLGGFDNNFGWGALHLEDGAMLNVGDGNSSNASTALYIGWLDLMGGLGQLGDIYSQYNIYYDANDNRNLYLMGGSYGLNGGGQLIAFGGGMPPPGVPEPATLALLALGLLGLGFSRRYR